MLHGTVGLQHATMAVYNAWCDRAPMVIFAGNGLRSDTRRPGIGMESQRAGSGSNLVRDYTKWDDQPISLQSFAESTVRACQYTLTAPTAPVMITTDGDLQEDPIPPEVEKRLKIPVLKGIRSQPSGDISAVGVAAKMLVAAENPVIFAYRYARTEAAPGLLVQLAELLQAPVVDGRGRMNIPNKHPLNHTTRREAAFAETDLILALEPVEFTA